MKVVIVHDYLIDFGGAERVLLALHEIYPEAPIYVSIYRPKLLGKFNDKFKDTKIIQSWFGYLPFADKLISPLRFLLPLIWKSLNLKEFDLIISSSSWAITKGFDKKKNTIEICYCHTPPRYLYGYETSRRFTGFIGKLVSFYGLVINYFMRMYDFNSAQKVDYFIANSEEVKRRIEKFYRRDAKVIYPPIEIPKYSNYNPTGYFLTGGRMTAAKNFDIIIKAFNKLKFPLKIFGNGVLEDELKRLANLNVEFIGKVDDNKLAELYQGADAFIVAQKDEDFGITAVEAQSYGCPVIAFKGGGYLESVIENKTGVFFDKLNSESLIRSVNSFRNVKFKVYDCVNQAKKFDREKFKKGIISVLLK